MGLQERCIWQIFYKLLFRFFSGSHLAAVCGYRIFVPLLLMGIAGLAGYMRFADWFQWISSYPAVIIFGVATILEIAGYLIPHVDNFLNAISLPIGAVAGVIVAASVLSIAIPALAVVFVIVLIIVSIIFFRFIKNRKKNKISGTA